MKTKHFFYLQLRKLSNKQLKVESLTEYLEHAINLLSEAFGRQRQLISDLASHTNEYNGGLKQDRQKFRQKYQATMKQCGEAFVGAKTALLDAAELAGFPTRSLRRLFCKTSPSYEDLKRDSDELIYFLGRLLDLSEEKNNAQHVALESLRAIVSEMSESESPEPQSIKLLGGPVQVADAEADTCYIDLDQAAALVNRSKRSLQRRLGQMPPPAIRGKGGKKSEWIWSDLRPWLEKEFSRKLPDVPPHHRH